MSDFSGDFSTTSGDVFWADASRQMGGRGPLLAPLLIGGALAFVALAGQSSIGQWLRGFFSWRDPIARDRLRRRVHGGVPPARLRQALLGRSKASVASHIGPPRTAVMKHAGGGATGQTGFWRADTWYYAVDSASRTAMAVTFRNDIAQAVEFFEAPTTQT